MPIAVSMNPMLFTAIDGKRYAVSGQHWIEVPKDTTLEGIDKYMVWERPSLLANSDDVQHWTVEGSKGNNYTVTRNGENWNCTCIGFGWRRKCKHIQLQRAR
mgnify:FL=1|tara:strand:+ start:1901 stop:2206 length:306 start_codon:yes stop_codon:yes gene_type:complete